MVGVLAAVLTVARVQPIGDSLTLGAGPGNRGGGYRWFLKERLGSLIDLQGTSVEFPGGLTDPEHDGHSGWRTVDLIEGRDGLGTAKEWVSAFQPDLALMMVGRNDPYPWADTYQNYSTLAEDLYAAKPDLRLVWSNVILPSWEDEFETRHCETADLALRQVVAEQRAKGRAVFYVDSYRRLRGKQGLYSDLYHLNDKGYRLLEQGFEKGLRLALY